MRSRRPFVVLFVVALVIIVAAPAIATFTPGFYKNRGADLWDDADDRIVTGAFDCEGSGFVSGDYIHDLGYTYGEIIEMGNAKDMTFQLTRHMIAAQLNLSFGACNAVWGDAMEWLVDASHAFLVVNPLGSDPRGADRAYADHLKTCLDLHNNIGDDVTAADYWVGEAYACYTAVSG